jgi:uncharacterized membrane protein (DUF4010 family)
LAAGVQVISAMSEPSALAPILNFLPAEVWKILLVLFLSFLIGLEREEQKVSTGYFAFGGVRTFPLIGLIGYSMALLSGSQLLPLALGFAVVGAFLWLSYQHKLATSETAGATSEMSGLATYLIGALVSRGDFWIATTLVVISLLLLELKTGLEGITRRVPHGEIFTFTKFLLLSAVILPILPRQELGSFHINSFRTWLVVVAVSAVSYGSYVLQTVTRQSGGVLLAAVLGGAYSSTVTTVALAKRASQAERPHLFSGGILIASGIMYLRLALLVGLFNRALLARLAPAFLALAALGTLGGWLWSRRSDSGSVTVGRELTARNPLELRVAFLFAVLFLAIVVATQFVLRHFGRGGVYALAAIMGVTDVDPFILGLTQSTGSSTPLALAATGILIAAASNNLVKGVYAYMFADRQTGRQGAVLLWVLAACGVIPLLW